MVFVRMTYAGMIVRLILAMSDVSSKTSAISSGKASGRIRNGKESSSDKHKISSGRIRHGKKSSSDNHKISSGWGGSNPITQDVSRSSNRARRRDQSQGANSNHKCNKGGSLGTASSPNHKSRNGIVHRTNANYVLIAECPRLALTRRGTALSSCH